MRGARIAHPDIFTELTRGVDDGTLTKAGLPGIAEALADARENAQRVRQIVRDVKLFSRPDEQRLAHLDLGHVLDSSVRMVWNELRHRARIVKEYEPSPYVRGNDARLGQVFVNLLVNAAQAIPEGHAEQHTITLRTRTQGARAVVEIEDTGAGIPPEIVSKIFEPFFTTKPIGVGTGLGLAICRRVVQELGGELTVESVVGQGTRFRLVLPPAPDAVELPSVRVPAPPTSARRASVLVVDDDPAVLKAISRMLVRRHHVVAVARAAEALDRISAGEHFDVVVSDLMMPEISGVELHQALCRIAPEQARRMIFLTGGAFTPSSRAFLDQVGNPCLEKPFTAASLLARISESVGPELDRPKQARTG